MEGQRGVGVGDMEIDSGRQNGVQGHGGTIRETALGRPTNPCRPSKEAAVIDTPVLERVLGEALRHGGEFAEVFAEDRVTSSAMLDDGRVEELSSGRDR